VAVSRAAFLEFAVVVPASASLGCGDDRVAGGRVGAGRDGGSPGVSATWGHAAGRGEKWPKDIYFRKNLKAIVMVTEIRGGLAITEAANLLTLPGRKCSNGMDMPLRSSDWNRLMQERAPRKARRTLRPIRCLPRDRLPREVS